MEEKSIAKAGQSTARKNIGDFIHLLQKARILAIVITGFIGYLTYDFHVFFKEHYSTMHEWQLLSVLAYAGTQVACIKFIFEHISMPIQRDHD